VRTRDYVQAAVAGGAQSVRIVARPAASLRELGKHADRRLSYVYVGDWWLIYPAGICIVLTVVAFNLIGDALRDALEVHLQSR
jgi:ABC-type dipeptide/oligopeptide/nickel transport system permease subunit